MHYTALLALGAAFVGAPSVLAQASCSQRGFSVQTSSAVPTPQCCPLAGVSMTNVTCGSVTMRNGLAGRSCVYTGRGSMNMNKFVDPFSVIVTAQGWAGGSSLDGQVAGGLSERVTVTARISNEGTYGYFGAFGSATPALAGYGGNQGGVTIYTYAPSGGRPDDALIMGVAGGGGAGASGVGGNTRGRLIQGCTGSLGAYKPSDPSRGGPGAGCADEPVAQGAASGLGGQGGTSSIYRESRTGARIVISDMKVDAATSRSASLELFLLCVDADITLTEYTPTSTSVSTFSNAISTSTLTPSTTIGVPTSIEVPQPVESTFTTSTPVVNSTVVLSSTSTPVTVVSTTYTPPTSLFSTVQTDTISPPTQTVSSTTTLATSSFTETVSTTLTPEAITVDSTVVPETSTSLQIVRSTTTPATLVKTATVASTTGRGESCVQLRLVYPAACCPNTYLSGMSLRRRSIDLNRRAVINVTVGQGIRVTTQTVDYTSTETASPTVTYSTINETINYPGPTTTTTIVVTASASTSVTSTAALFTDPTSTSFDVSTASAPSSTSTSTFNVTLVASTFTEVSTAPAPSYTTTETLSFNAEAPTSTRVIPGTSTPLVVSTSTVYEAAATPVTTTTTTSYARSTSCRLDLVFTQEKCPSGLAKALDRIAQVALIKGKKLLGGSNAKPLIIDCGSAGVFNY